MTNVIIATTGLQSSVVETTFSSAIISCFFADGATGLGCYVTFGSLPGINISRVDGSDVVMESVPFPEDLIGPVVVSVAEILGDGSVSFISAEVMVNIPLTTDPGKE